jgi:hypothetical protein
MGLVLFSLGTAFVLINRAKADGQIRVRGVLPHLIDDGLSILHYNMQKTPLSLLIMTLSK